MMLGDLKSKMVKDASMVCVRIRPVLACLSSKQIRYKYPQVLVLLGKRQWQQAALQVGTCPTHWATLKMVVVVVYWPAVFACPLIGPFAVFGVVHEPACITFVKAYQHMHKASTLWYLSQQVNSDILV